jgi:hypothetical protein
LVSESCNGWAFYVCSANLNFLILSFFVDLLMHYAAKTFGMAGRTDDA